MPPARPRNPQDDTRPDVSTHPPAATKSNTHGAPSATDKRRPANNIPPPALEKQTSTGAVNANGAHAHEGIEGVWPHPPFITPRHCR